jgi:hypothetical protein
MRNSDIEEQTLEVYNFEVSTSTITRIIEYCSTPYCSMAKQTLRSGLSYSLDGQFRF